MTFKEIREKTGLGQKEFADYFGIPRRSYQNWEFYESGNNSQGRKPPEYIKEMILRILDLEERLREADYGR